MHRFSIKSTSTARNLLILVWVGFFFVNLGSVFYLYLDNWIERDNFKSALEQLNASYVPFIGAIIAFYLGNSQRTRKISNGKTGISFHLALIFSFAWNFMIFLFILPPLRGSGMIEEALENIKDIGSLLSWLVFPAIGYYFGNPVENSEQKADLVG